MAKKVEILLSGCGVYDGTEIHESVLTLLALDRAGPRSPAWHRTWSNCTS